MSYRTYINNNEWLGNNNLPKVIREELERQGCSFDKDYCCRGFEIKDLDGLVRATEQYIIAECERNPKIANFNKTIERCKDSGLLIENLQELQDSAYIFLSVNLLKYVGEENYTRKLKDSDDQKWEYEYKLKPGVKCIFKGF